MTITLHHLEYSRSTRIIWLLEEMGAEYDMVRHKRDPKTNRSQSDLAAIHPLAKAPTIIIDDKAMVESGAIIEYLIERFGNGELAPSPGDDNRGCYLEWLHMVEGTIAMPVILTLLSPRFGGFSKPMEAFLGGEVTKLLDYANERMTGRDYVVGDAFSGADINLTYVVEIANAGKMLESRPALADYLKRMTARPMYKKAVELGGPVVPGKI